MTDEETAVVETEETEAATTEPEKVEETVTMPRQEADALRRKLAEAERDRRKLEAEQRKAEEKRQEEQGQYQELAAQRQRELEQERSERGRIEREARITRLAGRLKFLDPIDVIGRITADEGIDDASVESALERIASGSPHLVAKEPQPRPEIGQVHTPDQTPGRTADGKPQPPSGRQPLQSVSEWEALPQAERSARMDEVDWLLVNER